MTVKTQFDALLEEIGTLAKAMPADGDATIAESAADDGMMGDPADGDETEDGGEGDMAKSFTIKLEDGTEVDAIDGAQMLKALMTRVERSETSSLQAIGALVPLVKALTDKVTALSNAAKPRKSVVTITGKPAAAVAAAAEPTGISPSEFMAKAMSAQSAGRITGREVALAEQYLNAGQKPPEDLVHRVFG